MEKVLVFPQLNDGHFLLFWPYFSLESLFTRNTWQWRRTPVNTIGTINPVRIGRGKDSLETRTMATKILLIQRVLREEEKKTRENGLGKCH